MQAKLRTSCSNFISVQAQSDSIQTRVMQHAALRKLLPCLYPCALPNLQTAIPQEIRKYFALSVHLRADEQ